MTDTWSEDAGVLESPFPERAAPAGEDLDERWFRGGVVESAVRGRPSPCGAGATVTRGGTPPAGGDIAAPGWHRRLFRERPAGSGGDKKGGDQLRHSQILGADKGGPADSRP